MDARAKNPYPGPYAFTAGDKDNFHGRGRELRILADLAEARRASLLFSASGAGKSSLINAGLVPELERRETFGRGRGSHDFQRMYVIGPARVGGKPPDGAANVYVAAVLQSLRPEADGLETLGLAAGLEPLLLPEGVPEDTPGLLILDQFEELFTQNANRWRERGDFFEQLREALDGPADLHLLLAMREEYIAQLTPFLALLPERLQSRFRLERLRRKAALEAVTEPARRADRPFQPGVAKQLVGGLLGGGEFVEPIHLQLVCRRLWEDLEKLPQRPGEIGPGHLPRGEDLEPHLDEVLSDFYEEGLRQVLEKLAEPARRGGSAPTAGGSGGAGPAVTERALRDWFHKEGGHTGGWSSALVTPTHTRGLLRYDKEDRTFGGLPEDVVELLKDVYLVRTFQRGGDTLAELAHDRLVEPIAEANASWRLKHVRPLTAAAEHWNDQRTDESRLWSGAELEAVAEEWRRDHERPPRLRQYGETERQFIRAGEARRRRRRLRLGIRLAAALAVLCLVVLWIEASRKAARERERAEEVAYVSGLRLARERLDPAQQGGPRRVEAARALRATPPRKRDWEWGYLLKQSWAPRELASSEHDVVDAEFSPAADHPVVAIARADGSVSLWDPRAASKLLELDPACRIEEAAEGIRVDLLFSSDGRRILTLCQDGPARIFDTASGKRRPEEADWRLADGTIAVGFEGARVLALRDGKAEIWELGADFTSLPAREQEKVTVAAFCGGPDTVATGSAKGIVELWNAATAFRPPARWRVHGGKKIETLVCSPSGGLLISGSQDKTTRIWRLTAAGAAPLELPEGWSRGSRLTHVAFSPRGDRVVTVQYKATRVWSVGAGEPALSKPVALPGSRDLHRAHFDSAGRRVVAAGPGGAVLWDLESPGGPEALEPRRFRSPQGNRPQASLSADGRLLLTRFPSDKLVRLWDTDLSRRDAQWSLMEGDKFVAVQPVANAVRVVTQKGVSRPLAAGGVVRAALLPGRGEETIKTAAFSADGLGLVTSSNEAARVWLAPSGEGGGWEPGATLQLRESDCPPGHVDSAAFSPDGLRIVTTCGTSVDVWDAATGRRRGSPLEHGRRARFAVFSPDGRKVVAGGDDFEAWIWNVDKARVVARLEGHDRRLRCAAFSPDGRWVATGGDDWTARLWEVESGEPGAVLAGHRGKVVSIAFSPGLRGTRILTSSDDGCARIWNREGTELAVRCGLTDLRSSRFVAGSRQLLFVSDRRVELLEVLPFRPERAAGGGALGRAERSRPLDGGLR